MPKLSPNPTKLPSVAQSPWSPADETAAYASAWFAWKELVLALSILAGGRFYDWMAKNFETIVWGDFKIDYLVILFSASLLLKLIGVVWAARIRE